MPGWLPISELLCSADSNKIRRCPGSYPARPISVRQPIRYSSPRQETAAKPLSLAPWNVAVATPLKGKHASQPVPCLVALSERTAQPLRGSRATSIRASFNGSYSRLEETARMQQLQSQVFELKQRLVEAEVKRQTAEKAAEEARQAQQRLQHQLMRTRWLLAATALLLLLAGVALAWAELEAPPLGTMALSTSVAGGDDVGLPAIARVMGRFLWTWAQELLGRLRLGGIGTF